MTTAGPFDPRWRRQRFLVAYLRASLGLVMALALATLLAPSEIAGNFAVASIGVLMAAPLLRVAWLAVRWTTLGDWRYTAVAVGVLAVAAAAFVV